MMLGLWISTNHSLIRYEVPVVISFTDNSNIDKCLTIAVPMLYPNKKANS